MVGTPTNQDGSANTETRYRLHRYARPVEPHADAGTKDDLSFGADGTPNSLEDLALRKNRFAHFQDDEQQFTAIPRSDYETILNQATNNPDGSIKKAEGDRIRETTMFENVLSFDVRKYDPQAELYSAPVVSNQGVGESTPRTIALGPSDPGYAANLQNGENTTLVGRGAFIDLNPGADPSSPLQPDASGNKTYDSWSGQYVTSGEVGFDNDNDGVIDTAEDLRQPPPYEAPIRAIQVEIRVIEPKSGSVRSMKIHKYLGEK